METKRHNVISPDEIEALIAANPNNVDEIFELVHKIQLGRVGLESLVALREVESSSNENANIHQQLAA